MYDSSRIEYKNTVIEGLVLKPVYTCLLYTSKETLMEKGIIFCSISEAVREHPDLVQQYLGSVVGYRDNFFAALNSAVFSDG